MDAYVDSVYIGYTFSVEFSLRDGEGTDRPEQRHENVGV